MSLLTENTGYTQCPYDMMESCYIILYVFNYSITYALNGEYIQGIHLETLPGFPPPPPPPYDFQQHSLQKGGEGISGTPIHLHCVLVYTNTCISLSATEHHQYIYMTLSATGHHCGHYFICQ